MHTEFSWGNLMEGRPRYGWKDNIKNNSYTNWPQNLQSGERLDFRFYLFLLL
jgi:hypothetical protein